LPLVLGVILGYMVESNYRRALQVSGGDHAIFVQDPVSAGLLATAVLFIAISLWRSWLRTQR
jgi:putative tricarboxylic transport membrane protein